MTYSSCIALASHGPFANLSGTLARHGRDQMARSSGCSIAFAGLAVPHGSHSLFYAALPGRTIRVFSQNLAGTALQTSSVSIAMPCGTAPFALLWGVAPQFGVLPMATAPFGGCMVPVPGPPPFPDARPSAAAQQSNDPARASVAHQLFFGPNPGPRCASPSARAALHPREVSMMLPQA